MIIQSVRIRNLLVFEDYHIDFSPRMNLFVGPPGAGKSTIINAIKFGLTGDIEGKREKLVRQNTSKDEQSFIELRLTHQGSEFYIKRFISSSGATLEIDGVNQARTIREVNETLWNRLETDKTKITNYVFSDQEDVKGVLDKTATKRQEEFAELFGLGIAEKIRKQISGYLGDVEVPTSAMDGDKLREDNKNAEANLQSSEEDLAALLQDYSPDTAATELDTLSGVISAAALQKQVLPDKTKKLQQRANAEAEIAIDYQTIHNHEDNLELIRNELEALSQYYDKADRAVKQWDVYTANRDLALALDEQESALAAEKDELQAPAFDITAEEAKTAEALSVKLNRYESELHTYGNVKNVDACPACGLIGGDIESRISTIKIAIDDIKPTVLRNKEIMDEWHTYRTGLSDVSRRYQLVAEQREALADATIPEMELDVAKTIVEDVDTMLAGHGKISSDIDSCKVSIQHAEQKVKDLTADIKKYESILAGSPTYSEEDVKKATSAKTALEAKQSRHAELLNSKKNAEGTLAVASRLLQEHGSVAAKAKRVRDAKAYLEDIRGIFHSSKAPRMVSWTYLKDLENDVNYLLQLFSAAYRVSVDSKDLGFNARFLDGTRSHDASRLSAGQRVMLAICFRMAVNLKFSSSLGLLSMDEPTPGLGEDDMERLPEVFDWFKSVTESRGLQLFVVTHEPRIEPIFDKLIEVA